ncbi:MAG TPA: membrane dipeptidase, partial [Candidatus Krumholzibacteria bacterium]|nr:membrane dipeptidase [Candidatus Krumholzibacteria bacterium]
LIAVAVVVLLLIAAVLAVNPVDRVFNRAVETPREVSASAQALHDSLWIADFHSDALLWPRSFLDRHRYGLVDLPRLRDGHVALVVLAATTRMHADSNYHRTAPLLDILPVVAIASHWPRAAWFDPYQRALALARKARIEAETSHGSFFLVRTREDLYGLVRATTPYVPEPDFPVPPSPIDAPVGAVLSIEGMHAIDGDLARVDSLFAAGYRIFGLTHMFDNDIGGSASGWHKRGLTPLGRRVVARIDALGGIIDLAHASRATIEDVLAITSRPVLVSHTGLTSICAGPRNLDDELARRIAQHGGMIAIGFWKAAVCGKDTRAIARAIRHAIEVVGADHIALGSDFDGGVPVPFDAADMSMLTAALLDAGLSRDQIRAVMGENEKRFLLANLPTH